jgi:peptide/nickel transport system substrate-binding protein
METAAMDKYRIKLALPLSAALLGVTLVGCGGPPPVTDQGSAGNAPSSASSAGTGEEPPSEPGKYGGKLASIAVDDPKTLNYWIAAETSTTDILWPLYDGLNDRNSYTLKFEPRLAELPEISSDGYTYRLREGLKWSDNQPITADDVVFTLDVYLDPKTENIAREGMLIDVPQPDGTTKREPFKYRKVDDQTVEFKLPQKYAPAESMFAFPIAPKHKLEAAFKAGKFNSTWGVDTKPSELVASGPFYIAEYRQKQRIVYKRNPNYWRKTADGKQLPYLDEWVIQIVPDTNTAVLKFRNGESDIIGIPPSDYPTFKKEESQKNFTIYDRGPGWGFQFLGFNQNPGSSVDKNLIKLFQDVRFRRAASHTINRQRIIDDVLLGLGEPGWGPVTPANKVFYNPNVPKYEYDLEKAKALLAEIGLKDGNGNGTLEYNGKEVKFNVLVPSGAPIARDQATIITNDMRAVGLNAQFTPVDFNDMVRRLDSPPYNWEAMMIGFTGGPEPNDGSNIWRSSGPSHQWWPKQKTPATEWEAEIDKLWVQGAQELDLEKRKQIYNRWQEIVAEQQPFNFTVVTTQQTALRNTIGNFKPPSLRISLWNIHEIYSKEATRDTP